MSVFLKQVPNPLSVRQEVNTFANVNTTGITFTLCDRNNLTSKEANYFISFNLPFEANALPIGDLNSIEPTLSQIRPELQQLNVDKIIIGNIDGNYYDELIDGRTITFTCPQMSGTTGISAKTIVSSTYGTLQKYSEDELLGSNIAYLFCDEINRPYTGYTSNYDANGNPLPKRSATTWNSNISFIKRPAAVSFLQVQANLSNSDERTNINYAVNVPSGYPSSTFMGYNYDIPVGFVSLDKGFIILTHPDIVNNFPFEQGNKIDGTSNFGPNSATTNIYFTSTTTCDLTFIGIDIKYKTSILCYIMPGEFYKTTNPSWDAEENLIEEQAKTFGYDPVYISELALHNVDGEVIAYAKLDQPIKKNYSDFIAFTVDLNV